jgi:cell wall-associated NlpC family hydrolase
LRRASALLVCFVVLSAMPRAAAADPIADKRAEAARVTRELERMADRIAVLAENYNEARINASAIDARLGKAAADAKQTDQRAASIRSRLRDRAVESYVAGGSTSTIALMMQSGPKDNLAVRRQYVRTVTAQAADTLDELRAVRLTLEEQQGQLQTARAQARAAVAAVESKRGDATKAAAQQKKLLDKVQGDLAQLVTAESRRRADAQAKRVQADLAARRARDAAARSAPSGLAGSAPPAQVPGPSAGADAAVAEARRQLGKPYQYGSPGPNSFDCSGLTSFAWRAGGKSLPHSSRAQWSATSRVAIDSLQPGDLVFYGNPIHHVGLYVGGGQMIHAPESGSSVSQVSIYRGDLVGAGRVN